jgi:eukaryotic-like serine/threonine-protein kinase
VAQWGESNRLARVLCYRCGSHVPDTAERCATCGHRQVGTARMPSATGLRKKLNPALLVGSPYREGEVMADRYLVKDAVGVGPMGFVLRAADRELGIDVSVKLIHPRFVQTGEEREAFASALEPARRFLHPSLTRLHDVGNDQGWPYFTYTFLDGLPLRRIIDSRLAKGQTFALDEVEPILGQLMAALEAAHPAGAHGDLKAENILVLPDMLKVTDWGVAAGMPRPPFVQAERQKGAHRHLAPEYLAGLALEPRADVYSLGVLVGEMLTGLTPEDEIPELRLVNPDLPDAVEGFYRRALSERPESRYRSVREMFEAFALVVEGKPLAVPSAETAAEDGFEVVDFNETQMVVVQPEPPVVAAEPPPTRPEPPSDITGPVAAEVATDVAPASPATLETAPPPREEPVSFAATSEPDTAREEEFWAETAVPAASEASAPPVGGTLWSDEEDEAESDPPKAELPPPALSLAEAPAEPAAPPAAAPAPVSEEATEPEPPPPLRTLPTPHAIPRMGAPSLAAAPAPRPVVPSVGIWGPGARRTGAHAAVAVALPETAAAVGAAVLPPPVALPELHPETPPPVRSMATHQGVAAAPRSSERPSPLATPAPLRPVESPPAASLAEAAPAPFTTAHQGGLWSPGAALAELVSELRTEDAQRLSETEGDAAPAAKAALVVSEQRASRERLALMSASEEPTAPAPSVSGRPRKAASSPLPAPLSSEQTRDRWLRRGLILAAFFAVGMAGAALLARLL